MERLDEQVRRDASWNGGPGAAAPGGVRRRAVLGVLAGGAGLAALGTVAGALALQEGGGGPVGAAEVAAAEAARRRSGRVKDLTLRVQRSRVDLGGRVVPALTYGGALPGGEVRVGAGDVLRVRVQNALGESTSVHWHGLAIRNDADGVPGVTSPAVGPGAGAAVEFVVPDPGTYWFHPHTGLQLDWGLYSPLVVEDPHEPGAYDHELVVVLDDWSPGLGRTPEETWASLRAGGASGRGMAGMDGMHGMGDMSGTAGAAGMADAGDVDYPAYLVNGRLPEAPTTFAARPGQRVRLRIVNAAADTMFDVALAGHRLRVTHSDGFPVRAVDADVVRIAMGERYDAAVTLGDGLFPLVAVPVGKTGTPARLLVRTGAGAVPSAAAPPPVHGRRLALDDLVADISVRRDPRRPDSVQDVVLGGDMATYRWTVNGRTYDRTRPLTVRRGERTRLRLENRTMMPHPVHLHGHTFTVGPAHGPRKDTVLVPAMRSLAIDVDADNPGSWMLHCHNAFHLEAGMMTRLDYLD